MQKLVLEKKNRSINIILSMANSTIGSVALVLPSTVLTGGLFLSLINMLIIGLIMYKTVYYLTIY